MEKAQILDAIRRLTATMGGKAPGSQRFRSEVGVGKSDGYPKYWLRWSDAIREAGCEPNSLNTAYGDEFLIQKHVDLTRELGRFPIEGDLMVKRRSDRTFPDRGARGRLGSKPERVAKILAYCRSHPGFEDVVPLVAAAVVERTPEEDGEPSDSAPGYVYLLRHGARREFKIGRTNNPMRREGEIGVALPQELDPVHVIETDDPAGIETYWHRRFADRRLKGEWFALTAVDVRAFKRWKRIF
jgi:Meiotically up-regulated gene 113